MAKPISAGEQWFSRLLTRISRVAVVLIVLGFSAFLITTYSGYRGLREVTRKSVETRHAQDNVVLIERTVAALLDVESGQRGFILTGKEAFLERFFRGRAQLEAAYAALKANIAAQAMTKRDLVTAASLDKLIEQRVRQLENSVESRRSTASAPPTINVPKFMLGNQLMNDIRAELGRLHATQLQLVAARERDALQVYATASWIIAALGSGGVLLMLSAMRLVLYERRQHFKSEEDQRQLSESLTAEIREQTNELQEANDRIRSFAHELDRNIEAERRRLAREVHDQFGQIATGLKMIVGELQHDHPEIRTAAMIELDALVDEAVNMARRIASELRPPLLDDLGFEAAVDHYAMTVARQSGLRVLVDVVDDQKLSAPEANQLFRIVQEAVTNALRHSGASEIRIGGGITEDCYCLTIRDNGRGPQAIRPEASGLRNMRERAVIVGGTLEFGASDAGGTRVVARVPLNRRTET